jgi:hypothetical protein
MVRFDMDNFILWVLLVMRIGVSVRVFKLNLSIGTELKIWLFYYNCCIVHEFCESELLISC